MAFSPLRTNSPASNPAFKADGWVILIYVVLLVAGWISICGASHELGDTDFFGWGTRSGKQLVWIACSFGLAGFLLMLDAKYFDSLAGILYVFMLVVLFITPFIAKDIKGSRSWISLGAISLQPAEFAKCTTSLMLAKLIGQYDFSLDKPRNLWRAALVVFIPMALIILQKETGSALVCLAFLFVFYREGMPGAILFSFASAIVYFVVAVRYAAVGLPGTHASVGQFVVLLLIWLSVVGMLYVYGSKRDPIWHKVLVFGLAIQVVAFLFSWLILPFDISILQILLLLGLSAYLLWDGITRRIRPYWLIAVFAIGSTVFLYSSDYALNNVLEPHQQTRIRVLLGIEDNITGAGYNVNQSKIAIGSGGLFGKGFMKGTQTKLKYVPEQDTDFIFCTVGEEQGFVGASLVLLLFLALILRLVYLAERQSSTFGRVYGYCVLSILLFHVFINVGMVMGLTPVIGIPLPFFSYGGSSLWGFTLLLFIFLRIDAGDKIRNRR